MSYDIDEGAWHPAALLIAVGEGDVDAFWALMRQASRRRNIDVVRAAVSQYDLSIKRRAQAAADKGVIDHAEYERERIARSKRRSADFLRARRERSTGQGSIYGGPFPEHCERCDCPLITDEECPSCRILDGI